MDQLKELILQEREERQQKGFRGTFMDYLSILKENPQYCMLAHRRIYEQIIGRGWETIHPETDRKLARIYGRKPLKRYHFFSENFFGMDQVLAKLVQFFHAAAMMGEESRQVLYLVGPVGAGKSSIVDALKEGLINGPPIFAIQGCPMGEEPLHLVPHGLRKKFGEILGVHIEGDLCPLCNHRLHKEFGGAFEKMPVETIEFSIRQRRGIGVVPPVDPNNQDTSVLIGSVDISKIDLYPEDDPRVVSLNGAFNVGNRGIVEFIEVFKNDIEYLHTMITATQEKLVPSPGKGPMIYFDGVIIAHSNEAEWNRFKGDSTNEAILDRIVKIEVPYCLELDEEIKIYEKMLRKSKFQCHIAPHTLKIASMFSILTRLRPSAKVDLLTKLKIYNGEEVLDKRGVKMVDIEELRDECPREGMTGISTRFIMKVLDTTLAESDNGCIHPVQVMENLVKAVKEMTIGEDEKGQYLGYIQDILRKEYHQILEKEITRAFIHGYGEQAEDLFYNYLDHAEAFVNRGKVKGNLIGEELEPDEQFLSSIESQLGIVGPAAKGFRQDVTAYMFSILRKGGKIDYTSYEPLREAIEGKLASAVKELTRIITKARARDGEQKRKYHAVVEQMKQEGYCEHCCNMTLNYAANALWKD